MPPINASPSPKRSSTYRAKPEAIIPLSFTFLGAFFGLLTYLQLEQWPPNLSDTLAVLGKIALTGLGTLVCWIIAFVVALILAFPARRQNQLTTHPRTVLAATLLIPTLFSFISYVRPPRSFVILAIKNGNDALVHRALAWGMNPNQMIRINNPLIEAARMGNTDLSEDLIRHGADVNFTGYAGNHALAEAVKAGQEEEVDLLLGHGASVAAENEYGRTALFLAVVAGKPRIVEKLLKAGADPNVTEPLEHLTPLMEAESWGPTPEIARGTSECAKILIAATSDPHTTDQQQRTAAMIAAENGDVPLLQSIQAADATRHSMNQSDSDRLLAALVNKDETAAVALLAKNPRFLKENTGINSRSIMNAAVGFQLHNVTLYLLDHDVSPELGIRVAVNSGNEDILRLLAGDDPAVWSTILFEAARTGRLAVAQLAIANGADVESLEQLGSQVKAAPLHAAAEGGYAEIVQLLLDQGANVNAEIDVKSMRPGWKPDTPVDYAVTGRHANVLRLLVQHGGIGHQWPGNDAVLKSAGIVSDADYLRVFGNVSR